MCAVLPFLLALVVSLKCHVKLKAEETLNDLLRITVCVYCPLLAPAELRLSTAHKIEEIGESDFQPMLRCHCPG